MNAHRTVCALIVLGRSFKTGCCQAKQLAEFVHKEGLVRPTIHAYIHLPDGYMQILMVSIDEVVV